jgi:SAM-dependent methyltransferase
MSSLRYALLVAPSSNRVYSAAAAALTIAELGVFNDALLGGALGDFATRTLGSVEYVTFSAAPLSARAIAILSNLSSLFALFVFEGGKLSPVDLSRADRFDSDLITIQKYAGKTNETFTKLLLNVTLAGSAFASEFPGRRLRVLDPLCGRGTTLNQALMYGFDCAGVELDKKDFEAYAAFIQRWLKDKRLKHQAQIGHVKGHRKLDLSLAVDKVAYKNGETIGVTFVNADTRATAEVYPPRSFDLIVTDAPYGVQHGSQQTSGKLARGPLEMLREALPAWHAVLRPGGALGIAWNTRVAQRARLGELLSEAGLVVQSSAFYEGFAHTVDHAILRDLIVATKPAAP